MKLLTKEQQQKAKDFIFTSARPLEQALYRYHFESGSREDVWKALEHFQNSDGGFGHALEPDMRAPESSALATSHVLEILRELQTPADHPLVKKAIAYLVTTYDREKGVWRILPKTTDSSPHAPWWNQDRLEETFDHFLSNPRPELVGYLYTYSDLVPAELKARILADVLMHLGSLPNSVDGDVLLCYLRLYDTENLPADTRERLEAKLPRMVAASVKTDPEKWGSYCLKPLWAIPSPDTPFAEESREALEKHLDYEIEQQCSDGSWTPHWTWGEVFPEDWKIAEREWRGIIIVKTLRALSNFGRLQQ